MAVVALGTALLLGVAVRSPSAAAEPGGVPVTVTLAPSNPSPYFEDVTYTATLVTSDANPLDPVGPVDTLEFLDGGNDINGCSAQPLSPTSVPGTYTATCDEPGNQMSVGTHAIQADFNGDTTYGPGTTSSSQVVDPGPTTTTITFPGPGDSVPYGNESQSPIDVQVSADPGVDQTPSGTVTLYTGVPGPSTELCSTGIGGPGNGEATGNCYVNSNQLDAGAYQLTAAYTGDMNFYGSQSAPQLFTVDQVAMQMDVFPVPGYAIYGAENGNFLIVGGGGGGNGSPTGYFSVTAGATDLIAPDSCSAGNGGGNPCYLASATVLPASPTPYTVTVSYPGDVNFTPASTTVHLQVFPATTTTSLTVTRPSVRFGQEDGVGISATVTSGTTGAPRGRVEVTHGGTLVCTITDLHPSGADTATGSCPPLRADQLAAGDYGLTADYLGDGDYQSSVSAPQALTVADQGYWLVGSDGSVLPFGTAPALGSAAVLALGAPIVGMASTPDGDGYWEVAADGGVFAFGDAGFDGSTGSLPLTQPIVGMAPTADGRGYWLVARDGGVFAFGDATYQGSMGGVPLNQPIVGIVADRTTGGYWLVARDGGIFSFDAPFLGSSGDLTLDAPVVGMASTPDGHGYWEVDSDGGVFAFGDAPFLGSMAGQRLNRPIVAVTPSPDGAGYRIVASDGGVFTFGDAQFGGSASGQPLPAPIVGMAA